MKKRKSDILWKVIMEEGRKGHPLCRQVGKSISPGWRGRMDLIAYRSTGGYAQTRGVFGKDVSVFLSDKRQT